MQCKSFIIIIFSFILFSLPVNAFDKALNNFKNDVDDAIKEFEKGLKKLNNSNSEIAQSLDLASDEFEDLLKFTEETLNNENINASIDAIEFLTSNIDAAIKTIPPETITNMKDIDFTTFEDEDMSVLSEIMTDMNRKKMDDFKEMVTSMVVLEKQGFEAEVFMEEMQNLDMGLAMLNDDTMDLDFELAGLSEKSLDEVGKELDTFDKNLQNLKAQQLIAKVAGVSEGVAKTSPSVDNKVSEVKVSSVSSDMNASMETPSLGESTKEVTGSVEEADVGEVQVEITVEVGIVDESKVTQATEEVSSVVETSSVTETTNTVVNVVEESNIAETVSESTEEIEVVVQSEEISKKLSEASKLLISIGAITEDGSAVTGVVNSNIGEQLKETGQLITIEQFATLNENVQEFITDSYLSSGGYDVYLDEETMVHITCANSDNHMVTVRGAEGHNVEVLENFTGDMDRFKGKYDCSKL